VFDQRYKCLLQLLLHRCQKAALTCAGGFGEWFWDVLVVDEEGKSSDLFDPAYCDEKG
jgi:hypothetical protein